MGHWVGPQHTFTLLITRKQQKTNMPKYKQIKDYSVKEYYCAGYINIKMS